MNLDIQGAMKRFSGAIIKPVMFLAVAGILLAVSVILKMEGMPEPVVMLGQLIYTCVNSGVVGNLGLIFCIGLTCALANKRAGDAAVIAASTFLVFLYANNAWLTNNGMLIDPTGGLYGTGQGVVLGIQVVDMGVFIGIILGCLNGWVFNKFCDTKFPEVFSTYGGTKFVFLIATFIAGALGIVMCYVWPVVNGWINGLQDFMYGTGYAGQFVYGFLNKLLIPTGMHHLLWMPFMYSAVGGTAQIAGEAYAGSYNIFMAELGNASAITAMDPPHPLQPARLRQVVRYRGYGPRVHLRGQAPASRPGPRHARACRPRGHPRGHHRTLRVHVPVGLADPVRGERRA